VNDTIMDVNGAIPAGTTVTAFTGTTVTMSQAASSTVAAAETITYDNTFNAPGGSTVAFYARPNTFHAAAGNQIMGAPSMTHDIRAMGLWLSQSNPLDDLGMPIKDYLGVVNAGFEISYVADQSYEFKTNNFWVAMQGEADGTGP
jgi:hypothetical protein